MESGVIVHPSTLYTDLTRASSVKETPCIIALFQCHNHRACDVIEMCLPGAGRRTGWAVFLLAAPATSGGGSVVRCFSIDP